MSPSARYNAAGTSGIINIKTKKNKSLSTNGTFKQVLVMENLQNNGGTTLNYRKNNQGITFR